MENSALLFEWEVSYAIVNENYIFAASKDIALSKLSEYKPKKYNVFFFEKLYQEFASIETLSDIDKFINKYGVLGLEIEFASEYNNEDRKGLEQLVNKAIHENNIELLKEYKTVSRNLSLLKKAAYSAMESTPDFLNEVKIMRGLLELNSYKTVKENDIEKIREKIQNVANLADIDFTYTGDRYILDFKLIEHAIKALITSVINIKMKNVNRCLTMQYDSESKSFKYIEAWSPKTLLGCLYTMLHTDLVCGAQTIICKHCKKPHMVFDNRETELHPECRSAYNTHKTRERMAKARELYKNGKQLQDIYIALNTNSEKEIKIKNIQKWIEGLKVEVNINGEH